MQWSNFARSGVIPLASNDFLKVSKTPLRSLFDDTKVIVKNADKKPFDWNSPQCIDALVETLDKMILATAPPSNNLIFYSMVATVDSSPGLSSAGNLNPIQNNNNESTASGHSNKDIGQLFIDGSQSPPKDHGVSKVAEEIYEVDWKIDSQAMRSEPSSPRSNQSRTFSGSTISMTRIQSRIQSRIRFRIRNSEQLTRHVRTTAPESDWKEMTISHLQDSEWHRLDGGIHADKGCRNHSRGSLDQPPNSCNARSGQRLSIPGQQCLHAAHQQQRRIDCHVFLDCKNSSWRQNGL